MLAFRLSEHLESQATKLTTEIEKHNNKADILAAIHQLTEFGKTTPTDMNVRAKRCFDLKVVHGKQAIRKWVVAVPAYPQWMSALHLVRRSGVLAVVEIRVEEDRATMCKAVRDVRDLVFGDCSPAEKKSGPARRGRKGPKTK